MLAGLFIIAMGCIPAIQVSANNLTAEEIIQSYYDDVNSKDINGILNFLGGEYGECAKNIYTDKENVNNYIGIFNISNAEILSIDEVSLSDVSTLELSDFDNEIVSVYKVKVNIKKYQDNNSEFSNGINEIYFILDENNKIIGCQTLTDMPEILENDDNIALFSYDAPVTKPSSNPSTIKVYRTSTGKIESVGFKTYCKVVTTCEVGYSYWDKAALRACAMAIKNYGIARIKRAKYAGLGYNVKDSTADQVYNPSKTRITQCDNAVDYIWKYYLVSSDSKIFPGFHVKNVNTSSYAAKHKGVLSQEKAQSLASEKNYSWKKILKHFYNREAGVTYYNSEVPVGSVSIVE